MENNSNQNKQIKRKSVNHNVQIRIFYICRAQKFDVRKNFLELVEKVDISSFYFIFIYFLRKLRISLETLT